MRNLIIKRFSTFIGKFGKVKIYIRDTEKPELKINNVPCRLLGTLKDGEEKTFEVPAEEIQIFAISGKLSKNFSNDFISIAPGEDDYYVTGTMCFNSCKMVTFRFDGYVGPASEENRKRNVKKGWIIQGCAFFIGLALVLVISFAFNNTKATFSKSGMSITLTKEFHEQKTPVYTACYISEDVMVAILKEWGPGITTSLKDYADLVIANNKINTSAKEENGLLIFEWTAKNTAQDINYKYLGVVYKDENHFWLVQFGCADYEYSHYRPKFMTWAKSVEFD